MKVLPIILLILLITDTCASGQQQLLKEYNFSEGGYYVCLLNSSGGGQDKGMPPSSPFSDTSSYYYSADTVILNKLKQELKLQKQVDYFYQCGYPILFCLFKEGKLLMKLSMNIDCEYLSIPGEGQQLFKSKILTQYKTLFKPLIYTLTLYRTKNDGRIFLDSVKKNPCCIRTEPLDYWVDFEGWISCDYELRLDDIKNKIEKYAPGEKYVFPEFSRYSFYCNKSLYNALVGQLECEWYELPKTNFWSSSYYIPNCETLTPWLLQNEKH